MLYMHLSTAEKRNVIHTKDPWDLPLCTQFSYPCGSFRSHIQPTPETNNSAYEPVHFSSSWDEWRFTNKHSFMRLWAASHEDLNSCVCDNERRQHIQPWNNLCWRTLSSGTLHRLKVYFCAKNLLQLLHFLSSAFRACIEAADPTNFSYSCHNDIIVVVCVLRAGNLCLSSEAQIQVTQSGTSARLILKDCLLSICPLRTQVSLRLASVVLKKPTHIRRKDKTVFKAKSTITKLTYLAQSPLWLCDYTAANPEKLLCEPGDGCFVP